MLSDLLIIRRRPIPAMLAFWGLTLLLLFGWIPGLFIHESMNNVLDLFFLLLSLLLVHQQNALSISLLRPLSLIVAYIGGGLVLAVILRDANLLDFLMAYKFTWYMVLLLPFSRGILLDAAALRHLLRLALVLFLLVYGLKILTGNDRPTFYAENNFELLFLCLLFYAAHLANGQSRIPDLLLLLGISAISGSRSGAVLAVIVAMFCFDFRRLYRPSTFIIFLCMCIGAMGAVHVFSKRTQGSIDSIDRVRFFQAFLESTSDWPWWRFLTGAPRITPLPDYVCSSLSFYQRLFSFSGDGSCYSVILHSFNFRVVYDHGLIVAIALYVFVLGILRKRSHKERICVITLLFLNGLSVSSLNSVYAALGIALVASAPIPESRLRLGTADLPPDHETQATS